MSGPSLGPLGGLLINHMLTGSTMVMVVTIMVIIITIMVTMITTMVMMDIIMETMGMVTMHITTLELRIGRGVSLTSK